MLGEYRVRRERSAWEMCRKRYEKRHWYLEPDANSQERHDEPAYCLATMARARMEARAGARVPRKRKVPDRMADEDRKENVSVVVHSEQHAVG